MEHFGLGTSLSSPVPHAVSGDWQRFPRFCEPVVDDRGEFKRGSASFSPCWGSEGGITLQAYKAINSVPERVVQSESILPDVDAVIVDPDETAEALELVDEETHVLVESEYDGFKAVFADVAPGFAKYTELIYMRVADLREAPDNIVVSERSQAYPWEDRNP